MLLLVFRSLFQFILGMEWEQCLHHCSRGMYVTHQIVSKDTYEATENHFSSYLCRTQSRRNVNSTPRSAAQKVTPSLIPS
jgi:hypothetical protein